MNLSKQQHTKSTFKSWRHFFTKTAKYQKWNTGKKIPFSIATRKNKVSRNKPYQGGERPLLRKLYNTEERN